VSVHCCSKRQSCFGIDPVFMSRPTSSIRYGTCAVHHTLSSHPVAICSAKRSPFSDAAIPPHGSVDPLELVGFATDSPPDLPPPPPPPGLRDDGATARWMLLTGRRRLSTDNSSSTFGSGRSCRTTVGGPSSTLSCYSRRTTGTGPAGVGSRGTAISQSSGSGGGLISRTDSAPLPLSDYDDEDPAASVDQQLLQLPFVLPPAPPAPAMPRATRCERENGIEDSRQLKNCPHSSTTTTSVAVCRL